jgi:ubiquinone/menaquinone biosynthesis C-methylase UbiE
MVLVGRHAAWYDRMSALALGWLYRSVADRVLAELPHDGTLLDVGTGPGQLMVEVGRRRPDVDVVGIDPSADMVGHAEHHVSAARLRGHVEARVGTAEDLPFPDKSFDAVVSTLSSHHWADPSAAVAEQTRVLRPGGQLWIFDLRGVAPAAVPRALGAHFAPAAITRPRLGRLASAVIGCHQAVRASD